MQETSDGWRITLDASTAEAEAALAHDRIWNCFALADLAPPFGEHTQIAIAEKSNDLIAACLVLRHPALVVLSPFGDRDGVAAIMASLAAHHALPNRTLIQAGNDHLPVLSPYYTLPHDGRELFRMAVSPETFMSPFSPDSVAERLTADDLPALAALYALYPEGHFLAELLQHEIFFGVRAGERLVAAGGTHVVAVDYAIAVLGNIFTHPEVRRRGYARTIISALVGDLFARGCRDVALNVLTQNASALHLYQSLGFQTHSRYWTGEATLHDTQ